MFKITVDDLKDKAYNLRYNLIELLYKTGSGHLDTSLSLVEIWLSIVYGNQYRFDPDNGSMLERDRIFLSEGHACPLQYLINADLGYYNKEEVFDGLRQPFSPFQGHSIRNLDYGIENSNGSLGIGLWQAYGNALDSDSTVYCIAGDGEFQEPLSLSIFAAATNLRPAGNFVVLVNNNGLTQDSKIDLGPLLKVANSYDWQTYSVDGHSFSAIGEAIQSSADISDKPSIIICKTVKGKDGDPALAGKLGSHGRPPKTEEEYLAHIDGLKQSRRN